MNEDWTGFVLRMEKEADSVLRNNKDGVCITTVSVVMSQDGKPAAWVITNSSRIEPSNKAAEVLRQLTQAL